MTENIIPQSSKPKRAESPIFDGTMRNNTLKNQKHNVPRLREISNILRSTSTTASTHGNSFSIKQSEFSRKPPRVPPLKPLRTKEKQELIGIDINDDLFTLNEYKKLEIVRSRRLTDARFPFWFQDSLNCENILKKGKSSSLGWVDFRDLGSNDRKDFTKWISGMEETLKLTQSSVFEV